MEKENRKYKRVATSNPVSYTCLDADNSPIAEGMAVTVNVSQGGALLESSREIQGEYLLLIAIDTNGNLLQTKAKVVHCEAVGPTKFLTGIQFIGPAEEITRMIKNLILDFHRRKAK
jgi:hypothetical protein